ncbi:hypothetical protein [Haloferula sp. BvORR071]|uniref:hypothetical protein n=1 Tax=Haloferula sp. BvORR071 TaxID=1396141 RepID=UPI000553E208|nr:hypothetical protein [Haloferula sp. BvORR071]
MKTATLLFIASALVCAAEEQDLAGKIATHQEGSRKLAETQDELAADVQQLIIEQTQPKVIELLTGVNEAMDDASGMLIDFDTGGVTIAAETDVIEKIFEAAKEKQKSKQQQQGQQPQEGQEPGSAMMDMLQRMMGMDPDGDKPGQQQQGQQAGDQGGEGKTGLSDSKNGANGGGTGSGKQEERRVPKASGTAGESLPREFQEALDAFNRGAEKLAK